MGQFTKIDIQIRLQEAPAVALQLTGINGISVESFPQADGYVFRCTTDRTGDDLLSVIMYIGMAVGRSNALIDYHYPKFKTV